MTSNNLSTNMQRYFLQSLKSYWWLMLICGIAYFFAGPVIQVMLMQNNVNYILDESIRQAELLELTARWFAAEGFLSYYILASGFAILTAIVLFAYLQHKNQVNFYHSQPLQRQKLFWNQYVIGLLINFIPMLLMTVVMLILAFMQGGGAAVSLSAVGVHLGRIMLFAVFSYSLTILAGQLTGTVLTHICMTAVLHFCVPVLVLAIQLLCDVFLDTFVTSQHWFDLSFYFSPLCALVDFASNMNIYYSSTPGDWWYAYESIKGLGFSKILIYLGLTLCFTAVSWFLYGKRPSEATGNALVYRISEPVLKFYLMLIAAIVGGILFEEIGRSIVFFIFGALSCGILVHMVCEVIIQKDFRAMLHRLSHAAVFMVIIFALIAVVRWDLFGYDSYLPEENQVAEIRCEFSNLPDSRYNYNYDGEVKGYTGEMISPMLAMLGKVVDNEYYVPENPVEMPNWDYRIRLDVVYVLKSGREVTRSYGSVPAEGIKEDFAAIYNTPQYKAIQYDWLAEIDGSKIESVYIRSSFLNQPSFNLENPASRTAFLEAFKKDVALRQPENMQEAPVLQVEVSVERINDFGRSYYNYEHIAIFPSDKHVLALMQEYADLYQWPLVLSLEEMAKEYVQLDVYKVGHEMTLNEIRSYVHTVYQDGYSSWEWDEKAEMLEDMELIQTITAPEEIRAALQDVVTSGQINENRWAGWNRNYVILAKTTATSEAQYTDYYADFAVDVSSEEVTVTSVERYTDVIGYDSRILHLKDTADWLVK